MAGLGNTGIKGFLASAKFTGQKIIKKGKEIPEIIEHFLTGFAGYGWKIWEYTKGKFMLEIDSIRVRGTMTVYELLIQKIRAVIGALAITQGQGRIKTVALSADQSEYVITVEGDMSFVEGDFIRCQTWTGNSVKMYHVKIDKITNNANIHVLIEEFDYSFDQFNQLVVENAPEVADEIVQFGNEFDTTRQSAIYIHADESGQPAIDVMFGINSKDWTNCVKIRVGGDIPGTDGLKGFFVENGMIKGTDSTGHITYCIYPDGTAEFGDESVIFRPDRSGHLAGGAINWYWDDNLGKYKCVMDDVVLTWDNLDTGVKDSIKPEIGENGNWWIDGVDTGAKAEGKDGEVPYIGENGNWWIDGVDTGAKAEGKDGEDANLLPWIEEWDSNKTMIGTEQVVSPKMFSGTRDANGKLTGVALGRDCITIDGVKHTGIFALDEDELMVELDPINKKYKFKGEINALAGDVGGLIIKDGKLLSVRGTVDGVLTDYSGQQNFIHNIVIDGITGEIIAGGDKFRVRPDGSGQLAGGNISWDEEGAVELSGVSTGEESRVKLSQGMIKIESDFLLTPEPVDTMKAHSTIFFSGSLGEELLMYNGIKLKLLLPNETEINQISVNELYVDSNGFVKMKK